jgi:hypothetical protein
MPRKPKAAKKPYSAPSFRGLDANTAKAALETKAVPGGVGTRVMLNSISNSKAELRRKTTESTLQLSMHRKFKLSRPVQLGSNERRSSKRGTRVPNGLPS